jgi:hypothetical protein
LAFRRVTNFSRRFFLFRFFFFFFFFFFLSDTRLYALAASYLAFFPRAASVTITIRWLGWDNAR